MNIDEKYNFEDMVKSENVENIWKYNIVKKYENLTFWKSWNALNL